MSTPVRPLKERFEEKVEKSDGCWEWTASKYPSGYGAIFVEGRCQSAHRIAYELSIGPIPEGMQIDHMCHNRSCVNPGHLRAVTNKQNTENRAPTEARGVCWDSKRKRWLVQVVHNGRHHFGGRFSDLEEAIAVAKAMRLELFTHNDADRRAA